MPATAMQRTSAVSTAWVEAQIADIKAHAEQTQVRVARAIGDGKREEAIIALIGLVGNLRIELDAFTKELTGKWQNIG